MKNFVKGFLTASFIFALSITAFAAGTQKNISVTLNPFTLVVEGTPVKFDYFVHKGTTYVPLKKAAKALDAEVDWDGRNKMIYVYKCEPREYPVYSYIEPSMSWNVSGTEYSDLYLEIQNETNAFLDYLNNINLGKKQLDYNTAFKLERRRAEIENKIYSKTADVDHRTLIFNALKALDYIEEAIRISYYSENVDYQVVKNKLNKARLYASWY